MTVPDEDAERSARITMRGRAIAQAATRVARVMNDSVCPAITAAEYINALCELHDAALDLARETNTAVTEHMTRWIGDAKI